jgi:hypothetical protein
MFVNLQLQRHLMRFIVVIFIFVYGSVLGQTDTAIKVLPKVAKKTQATLPKVAILKIYDSAAILKDSNIVDSLKAIKKDSVLLIVKDTTVYKLLLNFPILNNDKPTLMIAAFKNAETKDFVFYLLVLLVLLLALVKVLFPKYFKNIFDIFFQTSFRQKQTREQLTQDNIAALLLNILFILASACFVALIAHKFKVIKISFWQIFIVATIALTVIYLVKFLFTKFMGWIFNKTDIAQSYSFLVFIVNKIIGVVLIPFLFLIAYSATKIENLSFTIAVMLIIFLFLYRFFSTYKNISNRLKINAIHFFLYFCSIEILPLLLMYKALSNYIGSGI